MPPGPFGARFGSRVIGAPGSSFCPEKTQIELACAGPAVGLPLPVISPAKAALALRPAMVTVHTTATTIFFRSMILSPFDVAPLLTVPDVTRGWRHIATVVERRTGW